MEDTPANRAAPCAVRGEKLFVPGVPSKPLSDVVNRAFANSDVEKTGALWRLKDTLQKGELRIPGTSEPRPTFGGADPALVGTEYAGIQVWAAPVDKTYLLNLERLPRFDIGKFHFDVVFTDALDNLCKPDPEGPPSPETFARDLERFVMNTVPEEHRTARETNVIEKHQRAVCAMSTIRAALDGFGEPAGPSCFLCNATPCICGRAL